MPKGRGARHLIAAFRALPFTSEGAAAAWAVGNALATLATEPDADALIELLEDRRHGRARQMLCEGLARTRDPRAAGVLIALLDDDDVSGHAVLALRRLGRWRAIPEAPLARHALQALLRRPGSSLFAKAQARKALAVIADPDDGAIR